ncbi:hypothetical protein GCM10010412_076740 [Nonomuraea recticatena]|uniref:Uncharacterized protein n=1 Tax=Nonomuraea recticatena TaxID=46178 RepID=A0ABN3SY23_9ACTN
MRLTAPQERLYLDLLQGSYRSDPADETLHELQALGYVDEDLVAVPPARGDGPAHPAAAGGDLA